MGRYFATLRDLGPTTGHSFCFLPPAIASPASSYPCDGGGGMGLRAASATPRPSPALAPASATASGSTPFESLPLRSLTLNGGGGIRTHESFRTPVFKTGALNRSATPPVHGKITPWRRYSSRRCVHHLVGHCSTFSKANKSKLQFPLCNVDITSRPANPGLSPAQPPPQMLSASPTHLSAGTASAP